MKRSIKNLIINTFFIKKARFYNNLIITIIFIITMPLIALSHLSHGTKPEAQA